MEIVKDIRNLAFVVIATALAPRISCAYRAARKAE
jgi:hypothetical protein